MRMRMCVCVTRSSTCVCVCYMRQHVCGTRSGAGATHVNMHVRGARSSMRLWCVGPYLSMCRKGLRVTSARLCPEQMTSP